MVFEGKKIVVGVCGGIAAYKSVELVSKLKKLGANVSVIMTESATNFVTPLTFQSISSNPVITKMFDEPKTWDIQHISLADEADLFVIAPATANIIGKVAGGIADDMLSTTLMATKASVLFVPAMNFNMYENSILQRNIHELQAIGYDFMEPDTGIMACGTYGKGRLPEPENIVEKIKKVLFKKKDLSGKKILITAGPTEEPIDPVRCITNHSSGKMGYAIAEEAKNRGAMVKLISGPVGIKSPSCVEFVSVKTALEMHKEVMGNFKEFDVIIMVAAVSDYRCEQVAVEKIKKSEESLTLRLVKNPDIAKDVGLVKENRILVGFCAETTNIIEYAKEKLKSKNLDLIIANDITQEGAGFGTDTNIVKIINKAHEIIEISKAHKSDIANKILDEIKNLA